jgi:hypothetical protein
MINPLHPALPPLPARMKKLPVDPRGFPVPWFVEWFHADGTVFEHPNTPVRKGDYPDFRVIDARKIRLAYQRRLCWVCGEALGKFMAFVIGPMCAVNRTSGEPPAHRDCGIFSATGCPFLAKPAVERRVNNLPLPDEIRVHPAMLARNPGVSMVWLTHSYRIHWTADGPLFNIGDPVEVMFFCEGRKATRAEIMHSIDTGMPFLREIAEKQGEEALKGLAESYDEAVQLVAAA